MAKTKFSGRVRKLKKKGKKLFIVFLYRRAMKLKRGKKLLIVCLLGRAGEFKRKTKNCLLFVYLAGLGSLKVRQKVVNCLFIRQGRKV